MNNQSLIPLVVVVGPTASGKTGLGIRLAKRYNGEIISADSMQIYKGMSVATAKPTKQEMQGIPHHLLDFIEPDKTFSVAEYVDCAHEAARDIYSRGKLPLLVGGTGLYINSVINNITFGSENSDDAVRKNLQARLEKDGIDTLLKELAVYDPQSAQRLSDGTSKGNGKRIIRAMEIYIVTGITMTEHLEKSKLIPSPYNDVRIGITCKNRDNLYKKINQRVDVMVRCGLIEEADKLRRTKLSNTAAKAIGYKELEPYFNGEKTLDAALDKLKMETRRYAKRQLTWFRRDEKINWIYTDEFNTEEEVVKKAEEIIKLSGVINL